MNTARSSATSFATEFLGRVILVALAALTATEVWWGPLVVAPLFWQIWDAVFGQRSRISTGGLKLMADGLTYMIWLSYVGYAIVSMGRNIGYWYGWVLGVAVGIGVAQLLGLLWPHRWHLERIEGRL